MSTNTTAAVAPIVSARAAAILLLAFAAVAGVLAFYFVGVDEGAVSVFGKTMVLHELMHDGRHLLGFPCH